MNALARFLGRHPETPDAGDIRQAVNDLREAGFQNASVGFLADAGTRRANWEAQACLGPQAAARVLVCHDELREVLGAVRRLAAEPDIVASIAALAAHAASLTIDIVPVPEAGILVGQIEIELAEPFGFTVMRSVEFPSLAALVSVVGASLRDLGIGICEPPDQAS